MKISKMIDLLRILQEEYGDKDVGLITELSRDEMKISVLRAEDIVVFEKPQIAVSIRSKDI